METRRRILIPIEVKEKFLKFFSISRLFSEFNMQGSIEMMKMKENMKNYSTTLTLSLERLGNMISETGGRGDDIFRKRPILGNRILTPIRDETVVKQTINEKQEKIISEHGKPISIFNKKEERYLVYGNKLVIITERGWEVVREKITENTMNPYERMIQKKLEQLNR